MMHEQNHVEQNSRYNFKILQFQYRTARLEMLDSNLFYFLSSFILISHLTTLIFLRHPCMCVCMIVCDLWAIYMQFMSYTITLLYNQVDWTQRDPHQHIYN